MSKIQDNLIVGEVDSHPYWDSVLIPASEDTSTIQREFSNVQDTSGNSMFTNVRPATNRVQFDIRKGDSYVLLSESYLRVQLQVKRSNGDSLDPADQVAFSNNGFCILRSGTIRLNNVTIQNTDHCDYVGMLRMLTNLSKEETSTLGESLFFFDYSGDNERSMDPANNPLSKYITVSDGATPPTYTTVKNPFYNKNLAKRVEITKKGDIFLTLPLKYIFSFLSSEDTLLLRNDIDIIFDLQSDTNKTVDVLSKQAGYTGGFVTHIKKMQLKIVTMLPSPWQDTILLESYKNEVSTSLIYLDTTVQKLTSHVNGNSSIQWNVANLAGKLNNIYFIFKKKDEESNESYPSYVFDNALIRNLQVKVDNQQYPMEMIETDFVQKDIESAFMRLHDSTRREKDRIDHQSVVSWSKFTDVYTIFCVDLSCHQKSELSKLSSIDLVCQLGTPEGESIPVYNAFAFVEVERQGLISMNKDKRIAISFT